MEPKAIGLTDAQLRASPVAISGTFALPAGGATEAKQDQEIALLTARLRADGCGRWWIGLSGGDAILAFTLGKVESRFIDAVPIDLVIDPGEILTVSVKSTANVPAADVSAALSWTEA